MGRLATDMVGLSGFSPSPSPVFVGGQRANAGPSLTSPNSKTVRVSGRASVQSRGKLPATAGADRSAIAERILAFLRARHPSKMADCVSAETGVSANTIRALDERGSAPSVAILYRLSAAYGPDFLAAAFPALA